MRVLFWSDLFWPHVGGAEIFAAKLLWALRERHEFIIVTRQDTPDLPEEDSYRGIPVHRLPFFRALADGDVSWMIGLRRQVAALKLRFAPELIHIHNFGPSIFFHLETREWGRPPVLFTVQSELWPHKNFGADALLERTLRTADWVNCVSYDTLMQVHRRMVESVTRSSVIFNSVSLPTALPQPLPTAPPRLVCAGRLHFQKGFDLALTALAAIIHRFPDIRLTVAGDGPERLALERQANELNLTGFVNFIGWVSPDKVPELFDTATIILMPSRWEGFGLVALEAGLMARPVIATRVGGIPEVVAHKETGLLVESEKSEALANALVFLLTHPDQAAQMGSAGRRRAEKLFSWERCVEDYDALYQKLGNAYYNKQSSA
jgi:glycogen synthase